MKKAILLFLTLLSFSTSQAQIVNIPDADFKASILAYQPAIDTNHDNQIQVSEALAVTILDFNNGNIHLGNPASFTGIEAFTNLTTFKAFTFSTSTPTPFTLNLSTLSNLQTLELQFTGMTSLNLNGLANLHSLNLFSCDFLTSLNITGLTSLQNLSCSSCYQLPSLNLAGFTNLQTVNCNGCYALNSLVVNGLSNLQSLDCTSCSNLTNLDLNGLTSLQTLKCSDCEHIVSLDVSDSVNLQTLECRYSYALTSLNLTGLSQLSTLDCSNCQLNSLITTGANNITKLDCYSNQLTSLNLSGMIHLEELDCNTNGLTTLNLSNNTALTKLDSSYNPLNSLNVSNLTNLTQINCNGDSLTSLNVAPLTNLTNLSCAYNALTSLNVSTLVNLTTFFCQTNSLSSLNINNLVNLSYFSCGGNTLSSLNVSNNTALEYLYCSDNLLTTLDITNLPYLTDLICTTNLLTNMDFSNSHRLSNVALAWNNFTTIDLGQSIIPATGYYSYWFDGNANLKTIILKNGYLFPVDFMANSCPSLEFICTDDSDAKIQSIQSHVPNTVLINSYCSFDPGGIHNTITGTVTVDINNNGCDVTDIHPENFKINISDGTLTGSTFSNTTGNYSFFTQAGSHVLTLQLENPYFTVSPASATINFANLDSSTQTQDFCLTPFGIHSDVDIVLVPNRNVRPGFDVLYQLVYKNKGNLVLSGNIDLTFNDSVFDFITATPNINNQSLNHLIWNYSNLLPFESRTIDLTLNLNGPMEIPAVNIGDIVNFTANVGPAGEDETPADNTFSLTQTVTGSYDPNDKTCLEGNFMTPAMIGDYLHYVIRFQNSGTAAAENIVVKDILDPAKFDISTLQLTSASHPQVTRITGDKVEFIFENINLPAEIDNEPGSHGYVAFKVKTKSNLVLGNNISNTADIYFDYNFPIVTNTTSTIVSNLSNHDFENVSVSISPNPVKDILLISADDVITSIQLFDIQGRLITTKLNASLQATLDLSQQQTGVYFVKIYTDNGMKVQKIIKQ